MRASTSASILLARYNGSIRSHWILAAIIVSAVALRFPSLLHTGLWRDEALTYMEVSAPNLHEFFRRMLSAEDHPPLFFLLMYGWTKAFGTSEFALKLPAFILSVGLIPLIYRLGAIVHSSAAGLLASAFYAMAPQAVYLSTDVRPHVLAALLLCALACQVFLPSGVSPARLVWICILTLLSVYTHYVALAVVPMLALAAFAVQTDRRQALWIVGAVAAGAAAFLPWFPVFIDQVRIGTPWLSNLSVVEKIWLFVRGVAQSAPAPSTLAPVFWIVIIAAAALHSRERLSSKSTFSILAIFFATAGIESLKGLSALRYLYPIYPLIWVFFASLLVRFVPPVARHQIPVAAALALVMLADAVWAFGAGTTSKSGIKALVKTDLPSAQITYLIAPDYLAPIFAYYSRNQQTSYSGFARDIQPQLFRIAGYDSIWNDPKAITRTEMYLRRCSEHGYREVHYVVDDQAANQGRTPYGRVWILFDRLRHRYHLVSKTSYSGTYESVSDYVFELTGPLHTRKGTIASRNQAAIPSRLERVL